MKIFTCPKGSLHVSLVEIFRRYGGSRIVGHVKDLLQLVAVVLNNYFKTCLQFICVCIW